jgi:cold shock protein
MPCAFQVYRNIDIGRAEIREQKARARLSAIYRAEIPRIDGWSIRFDIMSKGNTFRGPKRRGFDDDGPMDYETRRDRPRSFDGPPSDFAAQPSGGFQARPRPALEGGPPVDAVVKWFKSEKGFGFVELENGAGDAFLHINALQSAGHESVPPGAKLKVQVANGAKGAQVVKVLEVDTSGAAERAPPRPTGGGFAGTRPPRRAPDPSTAVSVTGSVKWFDDAKGFGFVASNDGGKDVFVHISVLGHAGITRLADGQAVNMRVVDTPKGREAISLSLA